MRWPYVRNDPFTRAFALLPTRIGDQVVWLEWYWRRFCGDGFEVSLTRPEGE